MGCCQLSSRSPALRHCSLPPSPTSEGPRCPFNIRQESALGSPPWGCHHEKPRDKCQKEKEKTRRYQKDLGQDSSNTTSLQKWCQQSGLDPASDSRARWEPESSTCALQGSRPTPPAPCRSAHSVLGIMSSDRGHYKTMGGSLNFRTDINNLS